MRTARSAHRTGSAPRIAGCVDRDYRWYRLERTATIDLSPMQTRGFHKATENLVKWSLRDEWSDLQVEMYAVFFAPVSAALGLSPDDIVHRLGDAGDMLYAFMAEEFFTARFGDDGETNVVDDYLKRRGWRETAPARRYLEALRDSTVSLYEVADIDRGRSLTVRDLIRGTGPVVAHEKLGSENAALRDCLATRVVSVNGKHFFTGAMLRIPRAMSKELVAEFDRTAEGLAKDIRKELRERGDRTPVNRSIVRDAILRTPVCAPIFAQNWIVHSLSRARAPELQNADGEAMVLCEVRFPIEGERTKVAAVLDGIEGFERDEEGEPSWTWHGAGSPSQRVSHHRSGRPLPETPGDSEWTSLGRAEMREGTLVFSANSRERAERGRELLASRLGGLAGRPLTSLQDSGTALEDPPGISADESGLPPEIMKDVIHGYLDAHYRHALDEPLPELDGRTPREAAATKRGRGQVVNWLKDIENAEHGRAAQQGHRPYDAAWIWRELGLNEERP
ncbi:MAG: hypothetical protein OXT64_14595 [Gammaproteobacteria bacterium]|nr:hypothetical protein [Gammaproteobacteria bacterium]